MRKVLVLCLALPAIVATASPAQATPGPRVCTVSTLLGQTSRWSFTPTSVIGGNWSHSIGDRLCVGVPGAPADISYSGTYVGNPCVSAVLTGTAAGVVTGGVLGETTGVTAGFAVETVSVFESGLPCNATGPNTFDAETVQVHVIVT